MRHRIVAGPPSHLHWSSFPVRERWDRRFIQLVCERIALSIFSPSCEAQAAYEVRVDRKPPTIYPHSLEELLVLLDEDRDNEMTPPKPVWPIPDTASGLSFHIGPTKTEQETRAGTLFYVACMAFSGIIEVKILLDSALYGTKNVPSFEISDVRYLRQTVRSGPWYCEIPRSITDPSENAYGRVFYESRKELSIFSRKTNLAYFFRALFGPGVRGSNQQNSRIEFWYKDFLTLLEVRSQGRQAEDLRSIELSSTFFLAQILKAGLSVATRLGLHLFDKVRTQEEKKRLDRALFSLYARAVDETSDLDPVDFQDEGSVCFSELVFSTPWVDLYQRGLDLANGEGSLGVHASISELRAYWSQKLNRGVCIGFPGLRQIPAQFRLSPRVMNSSTLFLSRNTVHISTRPWDCNIPYSIEKP